VKRLAWSTPLPRPITIPQVMTLKTLADVRNLLGHIPKERRQLSTGLLDRYDPTAVFIFILDCVSKRGPIAD
jgi:hypothetical protein